MSTIPASQLVSVAPSVLPVGGTGLKIIGLMLTNSARIPIGSVQSFESASVVGDYFGLTSTEYSLAKVYFAGFEGRTKIPGALLMAQYNEDDVAAFLRSADVSGLTLSELQAINGSLTLTVDGYGRTATVDLSGATSFSAAAGIIETAINAAIVSAASFTASIAGTTMTVSAISSGTIGVGQTVLGGTVDAGTYVVEQLTGTPGGVGTYKVSVSQTEGSGSLTSRATSVDVTYDSVQGAFTVTSGVTGAISTVAYASGAAAAPLALTVATGAVISQGAIAASPGAFMDALVAENRAWATFMTTFDPDASGNDNKLAFSAWADSQDNGFAYVCWDTDTSPTTQNPAAACLGRLIAAAEYSGTCLIWSADATRAAFVCGVAASIDFEATNGRTDFAYRKQSGIAAEVTSLSVATNLLANGYNYYGVWGARADDFVHFQNGSVSGEFLWLDTYINQIWFNNLIQVALLTLQESAKSVPFNSVGYATVEGALQDPIEAGRNFGAFGPGEISSAQQQQVNSDAGIDIASALQSQGYYAQVVSASSAVRAARGPLSVNLWYLDRGSVQKISVASVALQ